MSMRLVAPVELVSGAGDCHTQPVDLRELECRLNVSDGQREDDEIGIFVQPVVSRDGFAEVRLI